MHGGTIVPGNCLVKGSGNINEPFILEVPRFRREVRVVRPCHEAGLVKYGKKPFADVSEGLNDTWLEPLSSSGRVVPQVCLVHHN